MKNLLVILAIALTCSLRAQTNNDDDIYYRHSQKTQQTPIDTSVQEVQNNTYIYNTQPNPYPYMWWWNFWGYSPYRYGYGYNYRYYNHYDHYGYGGHYGYVGHYGCSHPVMYGQRTSFRGGFGGHGSYGGGHGFSGRAGG